MAAGTLRVGDPIIVLPAGTKTTVISIETLDPEAPEAVPPMSVGVPPADDLDVCRGDPLVSHEERAPAARKLTLNDIGRVAPRTSSPVLADPYRLNGVTGACILVDEHSNETVGAGIIRHGHSDDLGFAPGDRAEIDVGVAVAQILQALDRLQ
jgi:bifunctional enzyme CysN/CysC